MNPELFRQQIGDERGELYVFGELLKRGLVPYVPLVDQGLDALVRTPAGRMIELQIKAAGSAGGKYPRWFQMPPIEPRETFFIVWVEFTDGEPVDFWVFPSKLFDEYATRPPRGSPRDLDLDSGVRKHGMALRDLLCGFRNRWELIVDYEQYEHLMESMEDLEDLLTMKEAQEAPEDESLTLEEYEHQRSQALRG